MPHSTQGKTDQSPARAKEKAADTRQALAESAINASIDSMVGFDTGLRVIIWNDTTAQWSGLSYSDVAGQPLYEIFPAARAVSGLHEALQQALQGMKSFLPATGNFYLPGHFEVHTVPLHDDATGAVNGVLQILHDVAHRLKAENELKALNRQLSRQNKALALAHEELAIFAKITAHDLKEPLRKIYSFAEMIMMHEAGKLSNTGRYNFRRIQKSVQRMGLLTDDIINFSELSRSSPASHVDMAALLAAELERRKEDIAHTGAIIESASLPTINGYPVALTQLLRQLLDNALKFHKPDVPPQVQISCERIAGHDIKDAHAEPGTAYYHLSVADNGIGFEPQYRDRIFQVFQRLHPEGTYRGSGMGLALAQKAVRMHDGFIIAESTPGEGSIFHCYIPAS